MSMRSQQPLRVSDRVLSQFEPDIGDALIEFAKHLSNVDADAFVFMARKALCLHDLLERFGAPPIDRMVLSDRVLDTDLRPLHGKRIALVDDTLMVGTTLGKTAQRLHRLPGVQVTSHVFCRNTEYAVDAVHRPDVVWLDMDEQRIRTFCSSEVRAFSVAPQPYLADFPRFRGVRLSPEDLPLLLSSIDWQAADLTSGLQERHDVRVWTFFPSSTVMADLRTAVGQQLSDLVELVKVRTFVTRRGDFWWLQAAPIVTLMPLREADLEDLLRETLGRLEPAAGCDLDGLAAHARTSAARHRLVQHLLSCALGGRFEADLRGWVSSVDDRDHLDYAELTRHWGPWTREALGAASRAASQLLLDGNQAAVRAPARAPLPSKAIGLAAASLRPMGDREAEHSELRERLVTDFAEIFLRLYQAEEIPARQEASRLGVAVLDADEHTAPHRDRLKYGVAWEPIVEAFLERFDLQDDSHARNTLSLVLDVCNDLGICVPVTSVRDGVVYRAYRHGEDLPFADGELGLAWEAVNGLVEATGRKEVGKLSLEKLLVLLLRVGAARDWLHPFHGPGGAMNTAFIAFNLLGAVPKLRIGSRTSAEPEVWLSSYLVERRVLRSSVDDRHYILGDQVDGSYVTSVAASQAFELGYCLGRLLREQRAGRDRAPLDVRKLTVLATCHPPRFALQAVEAELGIVARWWGSASSSLVPEGLADSEEATRQLNVLRSWSGRPGLHAYQALHSASMKYRAYCSGEHAGIVEECTRYLNDVERNPVAARTWRSYWGTLDEMKPVEEQERVDPLLDEAAELLWLMYAGMGLSEIALTSAAGLTENRYRKACDRLERFDLGLRAVGLMPPPAVADLPERVERLAENGVRDGEVEALHAEGLRLLETGVSEVEPLVDRIRATVAQFGRMEGRQDFHYMLWYDIVDSRSNRVPDGEAEEHQRAVDEFRHLINSRLRQITLTAQRQRATIHCWRGDLDSEDDGKHIFISGANARRWVGDLLGEFSRMLRAVPEVSVRILAVPCDFANTRVYRAAHESEVRGKTFHEHWASLREQVDEISGLAGDVPFLAIADELEKRVQVPERWKWAPERRKLVTAARGQEICTVVAIGAIQVRPLRNRRFRNESGQASLWDVEE